MARFVINTEVEHDEEPPYTISNKEHAEYLLGEWKIFIEEKFPSWIKVTNISVKSNSQ